MSIATVGDVLEGQRVTSINGVIEVVRAIAKNREDHLPPIIARLAREYCRRDGADPDAVVSIAVPMFHGQKWGRLWPDGTSHPHLTTIDFASIAAELYLAWELYVVDAKTAFELVEGAKV